MARLVALALLGLLMAGCLKPGPDGPTTSQPFQPAPANFLGNWSQAVGNFTPLVLRTSIARYDLATNESIPGHTGSCTTRFSYELDRENRTLRASPHYALHPYDPGDLTVVLLNEYVVNERCVQHGFYPINENGTTPDICLYGVTGVERERRIPWQCRLPLEPFNDAAAKVWTNLTIPVGDGTYTVTVNGRELQDGEATSFTFWTEDPGRGRRYEASVQVEPLGKWPYSAVRR